MARSNCEQPQNTHVFDTISGRGENNSKLSLTETYSNEHDRTIKSRSVGTRSRLSVGRPFNVKLAYTFLVILY